MSSDGDRRKAAERGSPLQRRSSRPTGACSGPDGWCARPLGASGPLVPGATGVAGPLAVREHVVHDADRYTPLVREVELAAATAQETSRRAEDDRLRDRPRGRMHSAVQPAQTARTGSSGSSRGPERGHFLSEKRCRRPAGTASSTAGSQRRSRAGRLPPSPMAGPAASRERLLAARQAAGRAGGADRRCQPRAGHRRSACKLQARWKRALRRPPRGRTCRPAATPRAIVAPPLRRLEQARCPRAARIDVLSSHGRRVALRVEPWELAQTRRGGRAVEAVAADLRRYRGPCRHRHHRQLDAVRRFRRLSRIAAATEPRGAPRPGSVLGEHRQVADGSRPLVAVDGHVEMTSAFSDRQCCRPGWWWLIAADWRIR